MKYQCEACKTCIYQNMPKCCIGCPAPLFSEVAREMMEEDAKRQDFIQKQESIAISINIAMKATRAKRKRRNQISLKYY